MAAKTELYVGIGSPRGDIGRHWVLILRPANSPTCTWYHIVAEPWRSIHNVHYMVDIKNGKPFDTTVVVERHYIADMNTKATDELSAAVKFVKPQSCQCWVVEVLQWLEHKGVVASGSAEHWRGRIEQHDSNKGPSKGNFEPMDLESLPRAPTVKV